MTVREIMAGLGVELPDQLVADVEARSLVPDAMGRVPGERGYERTVDHYFAAYLAIPYASAQSVVTVASSEGTSVSTSPPDWRAFARFLRPLSPLLLAQGAGPLSAVELDYGRKKKLPMRWRGSDYDQVVGNDAPVW